MTDTSTSEITVTLVGGPADWRGRTHLVTGPGTGTHLISSCTPHREDWEDPAPRAVYTPRDGEPSEWEFVGWFPASQHDPAPADYDRVDPGVLYPALTRIGITAASAHHAVHTRIVGILQDLDNADPDERIEELATAIADELDLVHRMIRRSDAEQVARTIAQHIWPS